jgi:glycosyltransferase involved in cell wall biosynthesis
MSGGVLFVHNNFPAQFGDLARTLVARGVLCAAIAGSAAPGVEGVSLARYSLRRGSTEGIFPLAVRAEADLLRGSSALRVAKVLKEKGFTPDVVVGHPGWGETVFLREVWPGVPMALFAEFYYRGRGLDVGFDTETAEVDEDAVLRAEAKNAVMSMAYAQADAIVAPTPFQASVLPPVFQTITRVIHEGVDTDVITPGPAEPFALPDGRTIAPGTPVITYANNHMEPLRGLNTFARALPRLMAQVPDAQVLMFGQDSVRPYGGQRDDGRTWREVAFDGLPIDPARLHMLGKAPHEQLLAAMRLSAAHVYYTYPFVLSWSVVEAMASGCYIIGSDTPPLHDAIEDGVSGRLLPFFDADALSEALIAACRNPEASRGMRAAARANAVARFSRTRGREGWLNLLGELGLKIPAVAET